VAVTSRAANWRIWTEPGELSRADPGADRSALRSALEDCADTLSPIGEEPGLSTYWIDRLLVELDHPTRSEIAHGNLWVLSIRGGIVEVRMDVDPPESPPLDAVEIQELREGLDRLRNEVVARCASGHALSPRPHWAQRNPYP
jgi:hypothetical protein